MSALDQAVSSVTNFGSTLAAAILLSASEFGQFAIAYIVFVILIGVFQSFVGQELVIAKGEFQVLRKSSARAVKFATIMAVPVAVSLLVIVKYFFPSIFLSLLPFAVALPFLVGQEVMRFACAVQQRMRIALLLDSIWLFFAVLFLMGISIIVPSGEMKAWNVAVAWASAGCISFFVGTFYVPLKSSIVGTFRYYFTRDYVGHRFLLEFVAMRGASQSLGLAIGGLSGPSAAGSYRGAATLSGPLTVLLGTVSSFGAPLLNQVDVKRRTSWLIRLSLLLAISAGFWTLALAFIPDGIGRLVLGETWDGARSVLIPIALQTVALGISMPFFMGLRVHWPRTTLGLQLIGSVLTVGLFFIGLYLGGLVGAVWGQFLACSFQAILVAITYLRYSRRNSEMQSYSVVVHS
ncbi:hypothetical protein [Arthrobacter sp. lap29]|uniref:hypothetical protein n=1 Tax=Arthrobacter sp. lap29 TaxID=3056122 RepID=UPI0028F6DD86|nr:hypothetical protein [Arthrobacter sp. lap29]